MAKNATSKKARKLLAQFNVAFACMSILPLLVCAYLIASKFFSISIFIGLNGVFFLLATIFAILGMLLGHQVLREVIRDLAG